MVDADTVAAKRLASHLSRLGHWAYAASSGERALRLVTLAPLTIAVVDVALEDMTGYELVARLKGVDDLLPVVMTVADSRAEHEVLARGLGIVHYAPKPIDMRRLEAVIAQTCRRPSAHD